MAVADYTSLVQSLYISYFGRPADTFGLQSFATQLNTLKAPTDVNALTAAYSTTPGIKVLIDSFGTSAESTALYGTDTLAFVTAIYNNVLNRAPDYTGLVFWVNAINNGNLTKANASLAIMAGAVINTSTQGVIDAQVLANKVSIASTFTSAISTSGSSAALIAYSGNAAAAVARAMLSTVTSTTVLSSFAPTITATLAQLVANANAGVTFNLTTGVETQTAGVFNALLNSGSTSTLNSFDSLTGSANGSAANNVLNINSDGTALPAGVTVNNVQTVNFNATADQSANIASWTGVNSLNITQVAGTVAATGAVTVTAAAGTAITDSGVKLGVGSNGLTVSGGAAVTVTASGADTAGALVGNVVVKGASGAVNLTVTETASAAGAAGNISVSGGTTVTVNSTVNAGQAIAASTGTPATTKAGTITVSGATGAVTVNNNTNVTDAIGDTITGDSVAVTGGTTVTVNNVATASAAATATAAANVVDGAVTVLDGGTATTVTVNNQVTAAVAITAAVVATAASAGAAGGPGYSAGAGTAAVAAAAAIPGVLAVTAGLVTIAGATAGQALANASATITSATVNGYAANSYINSSALQSLTLSGAGAGFTIDNVGTTAFTTLALNVNGLVDATGITETGAHIQTLNVTTGGTSTSTIASISDASLRTLNIAGTQTLALTTVPSSITTIAVSGAAGFSGNVASLGTQLASFTTTSSGTIKAILDATTQTFVGSTGTDIITIAATGTTATGTKLITGGSATNNELNLSAANTAYTAAGMTKVTGFTTLGVSDTTANDVNVYDMKNVFTGFKAIHVVSGPSGSGSSAFTNVTPGTSLAIDSSLSGSGNVAAVEGSKAASLLYQVADATGASDSLNLSLGLAGAAGISVTAMMLEDANAVGIATLNVTSNGTSVNTITTLVDNGLSMLNVSGAKAGLTIGNISEATTQATSFTINNTSAGIVTIGSGSGNGLTDANLGSLTFTGTGNSVITNLLGVTGHILSIVNTGTGTATIGNFAADSSLNTLTITGNVALNADSSSLTPATATGATNGVTVSAGTDNAHINLTLNGAVAGSTNSITVGNGNNFITDATAAGTVNVSVGTGANLIDVHTGNASTYSANITLGAHTDTSSLYDMVKVSVTNGQTAGFSTTITGAMTGDVITFADAAQSYLVTLTTPQQTAITNAASLAAAITLAFADTSIAHSAAAFTYAGDTYVIENVGTDGAFSSGTDSIVHLVGVHTISGVTASGAATIAIAS